MSAAPINVKGVPTKSDSSKSDKSDSDGSDSGFLPQRHASSIRPAPEASPEIKHIFIKVARGAKTIALTVKPSDTVAAVKLNRALNAHYSGANGSPRKSLSSLSLFYAGRELQDGRLVSDYNVPTGATLHLSDSSEVMLMYRRPGVTLHVKTLTGKTVVLWVKPSDAIEHVRARLIDMGCTSCVQQCRLIHAGRQLEDGHTVSDYRLPNECRIDLVGRLLSCKNCPCSGSKGSHG